MAAKTESASIIDPVELGDRLRAKRRSEGLSIREVAQKIGVSAPTLSNPTMAWRPRRRY